MLIEIKSRVAQLVPVHFTAEVPSEQVRRILESTFADNSYFCSPRETWVVVDSGTPAEDAFRTAEDGSPLHGLKLLTLDTNRGKTGAIREGLSWILGESRADYLVTRDCDGDNRIEDLPRLMLLADSMKGRGPVSVFGCRPSLSKPMNWERLQWESITNQVVLELTGYLLARQGKTLLKNYWNQPELDLQSGYRLYDREAAMIASQSLQELPDDREVYLLACEISPFIEFSLQAGRVGQVYRSTQVEQPVSSYAEINFAVFYGKLLAYHADCYEIERSLLRQMFDNALVESEGMQSALRTALMKCRQIIDPAASPLQRPSLL